MLALQIIPVLDLRGGRPVAAKPGPREEYKELTSIYGQCPVEIAKNLPFPTLYLADLDAIQQRSRANWDIVQRLAEVKEVWADLGIRREEDLEAAEELGVCAIVASETCEDLELFAGAEVVSLDLRGGVVASSTLPRNPYEALAALEAIGVSKLILLDLSRVGSLFGLSLPKRLLRRAAQSFELYVGGGLRLEDFGRLRSLGARGLLLGSLIHRGGLCIDSKPLTSSEQNSLTSGRSTRLLKPS